MKEWGSNLGRKRIDPEEVVKTICINVKQKVLTEIEKDGVPKHIIERIVNEKYLKE
ncbi:hypothetical protein MKZ21_30955 [Paenibacillus sp. FSL P2-0536]|uniref:hypothetical protein n=1 Tax=Paenibacillus sp. FSL P2-0536 TaxID=2921629 RepID=UPI0030F5B4E6